jgi:hypothetical protein
MIASPFWVRVCLWRVHDRRSAIGYLWTFAVIFFGSGVLGLIRAKPVVLVVAAFGFFALATTWLAIRWRDKHGWPTS